MLFTCTKIKFRTETLNQKTFYFLSKADNAEIKLIDFKLSQKFAEVPGQNTESIVETLYNVAPEFLTGSYGKEFDIWRLGVALSNMLSGTLPFEGSTNAEISGYIKFAYFNFNGKSCSHISEVAKNLIKNTD